MKRLSRREKNEIIRESQRGAGPGWTPEMLARKEKSLGPNPFGGQNHDTLGCKFFQVGLWPHAIHEFELAVKINPWKAQFKVHLSIAYLAAGQIEKADQLAEAAIVQAPTLASAALAVARVSERKGDRLAARAWFERCLTFRPDWEVRREAEESLRALQQALERA